MLQGHQSHSASCALLVTAGAQLTSLVLVPPGNAASPISQVSAFYKYFRGFSTCDDFSWMAAPDVSSAPNRKV